MRLGAPPEIEPSVARRIREERAAGSTLREIAERLNATGPTARGGRWHASTLQRVLARD